MRKHFWIYCIYNVHVGIHVHELSLIYSLCLYTVANYPNELPKISVPDHLVAIGLLADLTIVATPLIGSPMLYTLFDAAKTWLEENKDKIEHSMANNKKDVCKFFLQGKCRFGVHCINIHPGVSAGSETSSKNESETQSTVVSKSKNKQKNAKKESTTDTSTTTIQKSPNTKILDEDADIDKKKERMRTATEVISRILWDPDLPPEDFIVGYLDRFIGIQEKAFKEFSWEDISTVGADVLAVPKHRIQYFKYKEKIVWDKRSQTDDFFGSRGGKTIDMIVEKVKDGRNDKTDVETETSNEDIGGLEVDLIGNDDNRPLAHCHGNQPRPTHFVCLRITDETVKARVKKVIDHVIRLNPQLADGIIKAPSLHVTLCMIQLKNDEQIEKAKQVFKSFQLQFLSLLPRCVKIEFTGVDNFRERLIYIKVKPLPGLSKLVFHMIEQFQLAGLQTPGNRDEYTPHITLIKLSRPMQKTLDTKLINQECYRPFMSKNLGCQTVSCIHLCSMHAPAQSDGFYLKYATVTNSLLGLPESFTQLVEEKLRELKINGYLGESECEALVGQLRESFTQKDEDMFDHVIKELIHANEELRTFGSPDSNDPTSVVIMRGLPGSGKSYLSSHCIENATDPSKVSIISADQYFNYGQQGSEYHFNPVVAYKAHQRCISRFLDALLSNTRVVIIDNTNSQQWEYTIYSYLCEVLNIPFHIIEIPCPSSSIAERFRNRNQHNLQAPAVNRMLQRWEEDARAVVVPPSLAYPKDWAASATLAQPFSILELCKGLFTPLPEVIKKSSDLVAVYSGVFLTAASQWKVLSAFPPVHCDIHSSHVTLMFNPDLPSLKNLPIGKKMVVKIVGHAANAKSQACVVEVPTVSKNKNPHITVSTAEGVSPKSSNTMLQNQVVRSCDAITVEGVIGVVIRQVTDEEKMGQEPVPEKLSCMPNYMVTSSNDLQTILPQLINSSESSESTGSDTQATGTDISNDTAVGIITEQQKVTKLFVFDFDGTLTIPPGPVEGRRMYEQRTGEKWPHKGWLSWPESLLPPIKVLPGPALAEFHSHIDRAGSHTVILTGRVENTKPGLMAVLENFQIIPDKVYFKPDVTDEPTSEFKQKTIKHLLATEYPDVTLVKFWDDMPENLWAMNWHLSMNPSYNHVQFDIIDATKMISTSAIAKHGKKMSMSKSNSATPMIKCESRLQEHLSSYGVLPTTDYQLAVQEGIEFLATQFCKVVGYEGNPLHLVYLFGSYPLKRCSDVDMCFIAPNTQTNLEWIEKMATQLQSCGVKYTHVGHSSRCPRLKLRLMYSSTSPVEYDMVVALVPKEKVFDIPLSEQLPITKITSMRTPGDNVSKVALSGPLFLNKVEETLNQSSISCEVFGAVVEMVVQILMAKREKGNAYHCMRSFHIVQRLLEFIQHNGDTLSSHINCDLLFKQFMGYLSQIQYENWEKLFGEFVPEAYISRVSAIFKECSLLLKPSEPVTFEIYEILLTRSEYPLDGYIPVDIKIIGRDDVLKWKAGIIVEARLPSYIRQIISCGLDVKPDGNVKNTRKYSFSVPPLKSAKNMLQQILRPFWVELAEIRKQDGVNIQLNFDQPQAIGTSSSSPKAKTDESEQQVSVDPKSVEIIEQVTRFAASAAPKEQLHLPSTLTAHARLLVHETAERNGLHHTSIGTGKNRHVLLEKP